MKFDYFLSHIDDFLEKRMTLNSYRRPGESPRAAIEYLARVVFYSRPSIEKWRRRNVALLFLHAHNRLSEDMDKIKVLRGKSLQPISLGFSDFICSIEKEEVLVEWIKEKYMGILFYPELKRKRRCEDEH